jgi:hypothetical protein
MQVKTLPNRVHPVKGFVYENVQAVPDKLAPNGVRLQVPVRERGGSRPVCSVCGNKGRAYDRLPSRCFEFVPRWG